MNTMNYDPRFMFVSGPNMSIAIDSKGILWERGENVFDV